MGMKKKINLSSFTPVCVKTSPYKSYYLLFFASFAQTLPIWALGEFLKELFAEHEDKIQIL